MHLMKNRTFLSFLLLSCSVLIAQAQEKSVKPGINKKFLDPELQVDDWIKRFEIESREVYAARHAVLKACDISAGMRVTDVGAGTGLYTELFTDAVGPEGWVYAVDISPRFLEHINRRAQSNTTQNVSAVLCADNHVGLPPNSVDRVFICDTYHHFEYPKATMATIVGAMKPGAQLMIIDFKRIKGTTREWIMKHVRAGKEVFKQEILDAGLTFVEEVEVEGLKENYCLRFTKTTE